MMRRLLLLASTCFITAIAFAQTSLWSAADPSTARTYAQRNTELLPQNFRLFKLNKFQANRLQQKAVRGISQLPLNTAALFDLPLPNGKSIAGGLLDAPILSEELQNAHPGIQTYQLINPLSKNVAARLTISSLGISGIIFTDNGTVYINPLGSDYPDVHMVYYVKDVKASTPAACAVKENVSNLREMSAEAGDGKKRTFKIAVAATGEYTNWAGSQANALAYITTTVNNITAIYERDATITFTLVTNNSIIFTDSLADPYPTASFPTSSIISTNQTVLTSNIGAANFDLGIVFNYGWNGGLAGVGVVCNTSNKGRGAAGLTFGTGGNTKAGPQGPIFDGTVAHEIGHEFSATHSFAADNGSCLGNTTAASAYEPGGGSTLMAYAGSCTGNSYQTNADLYFHAGSIAQIQSYVTSGSASCSTPVIISNHQPTVTVPAASYNIPISTPFTLTSAGADVDGNTLKYTWEQMDAGLVTHTPPLPTNTSGPNFRSYPPSVSNTRTFPSLSDILAGNTPAYEVLPAVARTMNFRVTARDEAAGGGGTGEANVALNVIGTAGPFIVTSQTNATTWAANGTSTATITWNVANTTAAPVSCSNVDILLSTDGGLTFPYTLAANTPNDGAETIVIPGLPTNIARIKIQSKNNVFFNINTADITITSPCTAEGASFGPAATVSGVAGSPSLDLTLAPVYGATVLPFNGTLASTDPASTLTVVDSLSGGPHSFSNVFRYDTYTFTVNTSGTYTLSKTAGTYIMNLYAQSFVPTSSATNFITSNGIYRNVGNVIAIGASITASLVAGRYYTLAVGSFSATQPALPFTYTISQSSGPSGGNLYSGPVNPGAAFSYTYVIVDSTTGLIKAIDPGSDLSNTNRYASGTFIIYGLSYSGTVTQTTLNGYAGKSFSALTNDLLYHPGTLCGNLSRNTATVNISAAPPAKLLPLTASKNAGGVLLKWGTETEQDNDHFEVLRSSDSLTLNTSIAQVTAIGTSTVITNYSFTDPAPLAGVNYYQVKQVNKSGITSFTNIAGINPTDKYVIKTYPNPVQSLLNIDYYAAAAGQVRWLVIDSKGATVKEGSFAAQPGRNLQQLNVSTLASGVYILKTVADSGVVTTKFIKSK